MLTIVMYHYVRSYAQSRYPHMKSLAPADFIGQLDYLDRHYTAIKPSELFDSIEGRKTLPSNALLLTFDDGYSDHFNVVRPALKARGLAGAFFPIGSVLRDRKLPNFNKVHFILARGEDITVLNERLAAAVARHRKRYRLVSMDEYRTLYARANHLDQAEVLFFKRMLQVGLPEPARTKILNDLFRDIVGEDDDVMLRDLYMDIQQLEEMVADGMYIGCHGYNHDWMNSLTREEQERDVDRAIDTLSSISGSEPGRMFCFPYGSYNDNLLDVLRQRSFSVAVTVDVRLADMSIDDPLLLPRLDTIHLPFRGDAPIHDWTYRVSGVGRN
jgi:peptidoglycan/xylan/chitin deacetylase (PgdA/CDA1 family)